VAQSRWRGALAPFYDEFGIDPASVSDGPLRQPMDEAMVDVLEQFKPPVVSFHFGLPSPALLDRIRHWKPTLMSSATTIEEGLYLQANGIDVVIAQGLEAGGHRGLFLSSDLSTQMGTLSLTRQLVKSLTIPVVAAGGIADADCTRAALAIGAAGVQVGTSFLLADEADTSPVHRAALQSPQRTHTALTTVFTGRPARGIVNRFMRDMGYLHPDAPPFPAATPAMTPLRTRAESQGSGDFSPLWASQNTSACRAQPAAQIVAELAEAFSTPTTD
jgi:nitronate monooxygenase